MSNYLHDHLNVGDTIQISAPAGVFFSIIQVNTPVTFIAGGIGITPLMSMSQEAVKENNTTMNFIQSASTEDLVVFKKPLNQLANDHSNFHYFEIITATDGYVTKEFLEKHVDKSSDAHICGPVPFMLAMIKHLLSIGIPEDHIFYEFFGPSMALDIETI